MLYNGKLYGTEISSVSNIGINEDATENESLIDTAARYGRALEAHFAEDNLVSKGLENLYVMGENFGESVAMLVTGQKYDKDFNPFDYVTEPQYYDYADRFSDCKTLQQVELMKSRINNELKHRDDMSKVGMGFNLVSGFLANAADPTNYIPFAAAGSAIKGTGFIKGAVRGAIVGGASNLTQEYLLKEMSATYTGDEFQQNLLIGTIISGGLGGIIGKFGTKVADDSLNILRKDVYDDKFIEAKSKLVDDMNTRSLNKNLDEIDIEDNISEKASIGAAKAPEISVKDDNALARAAITAQAKMDPVLSLYTSANGETRALANELFSTSVIMNKTQRVDTIDIVKAEKTDNISVVNQNNKMLYLQYYNDSSDVSMRQRIARYLPAKLGGINPAAKGKMTITEFNEAITDCIESGFKKYSDNKYIMEAAKNTAEVHKGNAEIMERLYEEGKVSVKSIKNYMPRFFSVTKVSADPDGFIKSLVNRYKQLRQYYTKDLPTYEKDLQQAQKNKAIDEQTLSERRAEVTKLNNDLRNEKIQVYKLEGAIHQLERDIDRDFRASNKTDNRFLKISPDLDIKGGDKEFAHQVKFGFPKELKPKSLSESIKDSMILIDDADGALGKDSTLTLQNYKKSDVDKYEILTMDELTEHLWEQGWYRERPYIEDMVNDIIDDANTGLKKYKPEDTKYLRREYEIDEARETLSRLGYDWGKMSPEQIDNVLSNLGDKATLRNKIAKARADELNKMSGQQKAALNDKMKELEYKRKQLEGHQERVKNYSDELSGLRAERDRIKDDIKESGSKIKKLSRIIEGKSKLLNATDDELEKMALDERARLAGTNEVGGLDFEIGETGGLLSRQLLSGEIDDDIKSFLERDSTVLMNQARKEFVDLTLIDRYGSVGLNEQKAKIEAKYVDAERQLSIKKKIEGVNTADIDKQLAKVQKAKKRDLENLNFLLSRVRETNFANNKYPDWANSALTTFKAYNILTSLGQIVLASLSDVGGIIAKTDMKHTLGSLPAVKRFASLSVQEQLRKYPWLSHGIVEAYSNTRGLSFAEIIANNPFENRITRGARASVDVFMNATGMKIWNKYGKVLAGFSHISKLRDVADKFSKNRALDEKDWEWLRRYGIDSPSELRELNINFKRYSTPGSEGGVDIPNLLAWKNQDLAKKVKYGIIKAQDEAIVTPGMDRPKAFDDPLLGLIFQFKQFTVSSMGKTLIPALQSADKITILEGMSTMVALGMLSVMAKNAQPGREPLEPGEVFMRGFAASGVAGWLEEPYKLTNALTGGGFDRLWYAASGGYLGKETVSPYETQREMESFLGPWWSKINNIKSIIGDVSQGKINKKTANKIKRSIPFQNVPIISQVADIMINNLSEE